MSRPFKQAKTPSELHITGVQKDKRFEISSKPKIELHVHLDGSVRPTSIWDLAQEAGIPMPVKKREQMKGALQMPISKTTNLTDFLAKFGIFVPVLVGNEAAIRRISYEFCEDLKHDNIIYAEARMCPQLLAQEGKLTSWQVVDAVLEELKRGYKKFGVKVNLVLSCMRHKPEWSAEILDICYKYKKKGVAGIDLAGDENLGPTDPEHIRVFQEAKKLGVHRTVHAGENGPAENVKVALDEMHAERIGHGYYAVLDEELYRRMVRRRNHFEACPISSMTTGAVPVDFAAHPLHRLAKDNANFSISSDDPTITGLFLAGEFDFVLKKLKVNESALIISNFNAVESAFISKSEKRKLFEILRESYAAEIKRLKLNLTYYLDLVKEKGGESEKSRKG